MRVATVSRKPLGESSIAANLKRWATGGINVDDLRLGTGEDMMPVQAVRHRDYPQSHDAEELGWGWGKAGDVVQWIPSGGRWPANVTIQHRDACQRRGRKQVRSKGHYPKTRSRGSNRAGLSGHRGQENLIETSTNGEEVEVWLCDPGCPAEPLSRLDAGKYFLQMGGLHDMPPRPR